MQFPHTDARWRCLRSEIRNTLFEPHSCRITSESVNMASAALVRLLRLSAVRNGRLSPRRPFNAPGRTVTPSRKAVCTSSGAILPKPKKWFPSYMWGLRSARALRRCWRSTTYSFRRMTTTMTEDSVGSSDVRVLIATKCLYPPM
ncbi:uncharacterized protein LOC124862817 isoform X1 [Girardinichthys multiradiatus]|uniref:uncharacterized protein LOC124862817 isoform X1 n=1 Tax=Girardinichthys multiradiatus TaxID=208333 RepID=UPI001FAD6A3E|nr:uncharacterized protein LOC124862817 isoform X1 [Girardinichthys multiradiatus]